MKAQERAAEVLAFQETAGERALHFFHDSYDQPGVTVPSENHRET